MKKTKQFLSALVCGIICLNAANAASDNGISYGGGPVMVNPTHIYYIWYGDWSADPTAKPILTDLAANIGGSAWYNINTTYYNSTNQPVSPSVSFGGLGFSGNAYDAGSQGAVIFNHGMIISKAIDAKSLPADPDGVYFILAAKGVTDNSSLPGREFCRTNCGYHERNWYTDYSKYYITGNFADVKQTEIKFSFVGDPKTCGSVDRANVCVSPNLFEYNLVSYSPNNNISADAMANAIAHEFVEAVTDPDAFSGWRDRTTSSALTGENADKCSRAYGAITTSGFRRFNMTLGTRDYLIQANWINEGGGYCAMGRPTPVLACSLIFNGSSNIPSGGSVTYYSYGTLTPLPAGSIAYWYGTKNGVVDVSGQNIGAPGFYTVTNTTGSEGIYVRNAQIRDSLGQTLCTTNNVTVTFLASTNKAPVITALTATPQTLLDNTTSQLQVSANDPDAKPSPLSYQWSILSGGGSLSSNTAANPVYTPATVSSATPVTLNVVVSDGASTVTQSITLTVNHAIAPNQAPVISALTATPQTLLDNATSKLLVSASDPDAKPSPLSYQWSVTSGGGSLSSATIANPVYTPASVTSATPVTLNVVVSDGAITVNKSITLTVNPAPKCELFVSGSPIKPGATVTYYINGLSIPAGVYAFWYGTRDGIADLMGTYAGRPGFYSFLNSAGNAGVYVRWVEFLNMQGQTICATNTQTVQFF